MCRLHQLWALGIVLGLALLPYDGAAREATNATPKAPADKYITAGSIDLRTLLPDPPADNSDATKSEIEELLKIQESRTPLQVERAKSEDPLVVYAFATVLGTNFAPARLPVTDRFLKRVGAEVSAVSSGAKTLWKRTRPYKVDKRLKPVGREAASKSYPSGHTTRAFAWAVVLGELFPGKKAELLERAKEIGYDRMIAGVHYRSDVEAGTKLGKAIGEKLLESDALQKDLAAARREVEQAPGGKP
jgi:acid phosphatase (class A)